MKDNNSILKFVLIGLLILVAFFLFRDIIGRDSSGTEEKTETSTPDNTATVAGKIVFTGLKPDEGDKGYIGIEYKKSSDTTYVDANVQLPLENDSAFSTHKATAGQTYDVKAYVDINGEKIKYSDIVRITAPATNVSIPINVSWNDLPDEVAQEYPVSIEGKVTINGYIPEGSAVRIKYRTTTEGSYVDLVPTLPAQKVVSYEIPNALNGRDYKVYAELLNSNQEAIGTSSVQSPTAPATNVNLTLNSTAQQPQPQKTTITGYVVINGTVDSSKNMEVYLRNLETDEVKTIATLPATSNSWWSYDQAVVGIKYRVNAMAYAQDGKQVYSKAVEFTAPSTNIELTIDTGTYIEKPDQKPTLESCSDVKDGVYKAKLRYENMSRATRYWIQVGSDHGTNDVYDSVQNGPKTDVPIYVEVDVKDGSDYYTRYAYSYCTDGCTGANNFSDFSSTLEFECPKD